MMEIGKVVRNLMADSCPTILGSLEDRRDRLKQQLADTEEAIKAMMENPQVERVLNLLTKVGR